MYDLNPANTQVHGAPEMAGRMWALFSFFHAVGGKTGPVDIVARGMKSPFMHRVNRASVKKLNAIQISNSLNALVLMCMLSDRGIKNLAQALVYILRLVTKEEEHVYETASVLICDELQSKHLEPLIDCSSELIKIVTADLRLVDLIFKKLEAARIV
jgi:hypothetical protein